MSKVFRLYKEGTNTYQGWNESPSFPYNSNARDTIDDPDGASAHNEITSIPSPFARIDLVKTAFREVCKMAAGNIKKLDGKTIFHKMVSDALDVGEIFFNYDKLKDKVEIITWNPRQALQEMMHSGNMGHLYLADALEKYMESDARAYNFDQLNNIYLLNYLNGPDEINVIGATSPSTFFFSGANNLEYIQDIFFANNDRPFDGDYAPLHQRDLEYIKSLWTLRKSIPGFASLFPEIEAYLNLTFKAITDQKVKSQLNAISEADADQFNTIDIRTDGQNNQVEVLGYPLLQVKTKTNVESNFTIKADRNIEGKKPLVLPVESGNKYAELQYASGLWGTTNKAPFISEQENIAERSLPYEGTTFPYLTISDFLEESIIRVPHNLNEKLYFNGNIDKTNEKESFLLPIKPLFFKYFDAESLFSPLPDGKKMIEMRTYAAGMVEVTLRIPIEGSKRIAYIEYQRCYYPERYADISETTNEGSIVDCAFSGVVMPSIKFQNDEEARYKVVCASTFSNNYTLNFYRQDEAITNVQTDCRNTTRGQFDYKAVIHTVEKSNFEFIRITNYNGVSNIIVPMFMTHQNLDNFEFAVDLGTSNTHIEYKMEGAKTSEPFHYSDTEGFISPIFEQSYLIDEGQQYEMDADLKAENDLIRRDVLPMTIGEGSDFFFPTRTALSEAKCIEWKEKQRTFGLCNLDVTYNKLLGLSYNKGHQVNIKWSNEATGQTILEMYIRHLMMMIRNKVVVNNGNLSGTKIVWFYPNSMSPRRRAAMKNAWDDAYKDLFGANSSTNCLSESVAPINFYFRRYASATNLVNVDIGGGTTDIAFAERGVVKYTTSFKLGANALFQDSLADGNPHNGIVDSFKDRIREVLESKRDKAGISDLINIFDSNLDEPANMASFLFSLKNNSATKDFDLKTIDLNRILQNDDKFKIVFILFYTSIIYHIAQIVKQKGLTIPRHIAFSGNGSKIISIISTDAKIIGAYTKAVFEQVLEVEHKEPLDILGLEVDNNPKETTCKGGLASFGSTANDPEQLVLLNSAGAFANNESTYASLDNNYKDEAVKSVDDFFNFTFRQMPKVFNLDNNFGVDNAALKIADEVCHRDIAIFLDKGIALSEHESGNKENVIEDALTFYPIKGAMQEVSQQIQEYYLNQ